MLSDRVQTILSQFLIHYWWLIPIFLILTLFKTAWMKGILGEFLVNLSARFHLDKDIYHLYKNVTLPTEDGSTQIDHIIVSPFGVFVIETKNMKGWIFGSAKQMTWTQKIYKHTTKFQNPLLQNYKHTQTLIAALEINPKVVFSLIVFIGDSTFKTPMPDNVVYAKGYIDFIKNKQQRLLSEKDIQRIGQQIESGRLKPSIKTHRQHVQHVKSIVQEKQTRLDNHQCPKCGKPMLLRTSKSGPNKGHQFWGCSAFPKCRTIKPV